MVKEIIIIQEGRLFSKDSFDEKFISMCLKNNDIYKIESDNKIIIDLDKNSIASYTKYLIKGMEGSRELPAIHLNQILSGIIIFLILFLIFMIGSRPTSDEIKEIIKPNDKRQIIPNINTNNNIPVITK